MAGKKKKSILVQLFPNISPNTAPSGPMGQQPVKVNGEEEVTDCFIQSPPLSAHAVTKCSLRDFSS